MRISEILAEAKAVKQRLDAKCWTGKHKEGTKIKGGVRVNNCVPNENVNEFAPSNGSNGSGRWYTDNQMTELVGDGWWEEMDIKDLSSKATVDEVAMNPTAYAQSVKQGQSEGVLVGFEFEVCVPEETMVAQAEAAEQQRAGQPTQTIAPERIKQILNNRPDIFNNAAIDDLNRLLKPKETSRFPSISDALQKIAETNLEKTRALLAEIPADLLSEYKRLAKNKIARQARNGTADLDTPEKREQAVARDIMQRYDGHYHYGMPDADNARRVIQGLSASTVGPGLHDALKVMWPRVLMWPRVRNIDNIFKNLDRYFEYDPTELYNTFNMRRFDPTLSYDERNAGSSRGGFTGAAQALKPALESTMDAKVNVFTSYHQRAKNMTDWYIEPDGSLQPNSGDGAAEVVGPPEAPKQALESLKKFFAMAKELKLYTSKRNNTGLHINVSIPKDLDVLKLAVMLGDQYVLKKFGRENNNYARSIMQNLQSTGERKVGSTVPSDTTTPFGSTASSIDLSMLQQIAKDISRDHFSSINFTGKYVSFRHSGGDYLRDYTEILNVVGRFVRAMVIASDPAAYRNEYLKAVTKLVGQRQPADADQRIRYIEYIKQTGLIVKTVELYLRKERFENPNTANFAAALSRYNTLVPGVNYSITNPSDEAKRMLIAKSHPEGRARTEMSNPELSPDQQFAHCVLYPMTFNEAISDTRPDGSLSSYRGVDLVHIDGNTVGYRLTTLEQIPAADPRAVAFLRKLFQLRV